MPACSVLWCKNRTGLKNRCNSTITFHIFPKDEKLREIWINATGKSLKKWIPSAHSTICSSHFSPDLFEKSKSGKRTYLENTAIPTLNLPFNTNPVKNGVEFNNTSVILQTIPVEKKIIEFNSVPIMFQANPINNRVDSDSSLTFPISQVKKEIVEFSDTSGVFQECPIKNEVIEFSDASLMSPESQVRKEAVTSSDILVMSQTCPIKTEFVECSDHDNSLMCQASPDEKEINLGNVAVMFQGIPAMKVIGFSNVRTEPPHDCNDTPMEKKLKRRIQELTYFSRKKIRHLQYKNRIQRLKIAKLEHRLQSRSDKSLYNPNDVTLQNISLMSAEIANQQLNQLKVNKKTGFEYSSDLKSFAVTLYYHSPKAYHFVRKSFNTCLPGESTIKKWFRSNKALLGLTDEALATQGH